MTARHSTPRTPPPRWPAALLPLLLLSACGGDPAATPQGPAAMRVQVIQAQPQTATAPLQLNGRIVARDAQLIYAQHEGLRVQRVLVEMGESVRAGQPLVELDGRALRAEQQQAEQSHQRASAALASARAQLALVESRLTQQLDETRRFEQVADSGAVSPLDLGARKALAEQLRQERQSALHALQSAQAEQTSTLAAATLARQRAQDTLVRAPVAGVISERHAVAGMLTSASGEPLFRLAAGQDREFEAALDPAQAQRLRIGAPARIEVPRADRLGRASVPGRVRALDASLGDQGRRGLVRIAFDAGALPPLSLGMAASASVDTLTADGLRIPASAVQFDPHPWVYVVDDNAIVRKRRVDLGPDGALVVAGLRAGDWVVRSSAALLNNGQRIEPLRAASPPAGSASAAASAPASGASR
ncbi:efflux RND transporter periplasmic adaptor subunit [Pelomonas sp. CA6]|uniref:efflux RND transporter periplasmic adaptor subunit n=1 Tax=Pelomonas sp. CA6 TaxID=2907999 RepID=UPI001F4BDB9A|nr:efflux RND transporter periplasmic adaptor subunit [Pelomonas sp. CA6]MCH7343166.1 efflux RND transporter periplasmic adaptor subunit [Pelomonas sp. CA6]